MLTFIILLIVDNLQTCSTKHDWRL